MVSFCPSCLSRYSFSIRMSMHFLITGIFGLNLGASWFSTSVISCWCFSCFLVFMILTIAAWMSNFLSSSMCLWVSSISCLCSVFMGMLMFTRSFLFLYWWKSDTVVSEAMSWSTSMASGLGPTNNLDRSRICKTWMSMSILIWVASASLATVHESASLKASRTDIWNVDACSVYLFLKQLVTSSPLLMWKSQFSFLPLCWPP